jgi:hypothetical protein
MSQNGRLNLPETLFRESQKIRSGKQPSLTGKIQVGRIVSEAAGKINPAKRSF